MSDPNAPTPGYFSDEDLTAYLDGEADVGLSATIEEAVGQDTDLANRLAQLDLNVPSLRAAFDGVLAIAPDMQSGMPFANDKLNAPKRSTPWVGLAATACMCFGLGIASNAYFAKTTGIEGWRQYAAAYHALYVTETLSVVDRSPHLAAAELELASAQIQAKIVPDALSIAEMDYKRAQILGFEGAPLLQLAFLSDSGVPYAFCIMKSRNDQPNELVTNEIEGMSAARWSENGFEFLLIGGEDGSLIRSAAEKLRLAVSPS